MLGLRLRHFKFWCQSVLPLVYDESLSYYEVLCKVVDYINKLIDSDKEIIENAEELRNELSEVQHWIDTFDTEYINQVIEEFIATIVFFGLTDSGYFVAYLPESWDDIIFQTTGYDVDIPEMPDYGHLVLSY